MRVGNAAREKGDKRLVGELEQVLRRIVASLEHAVKQARSDGEKWRDAAKKFDRNLIGI